MSNPFDYPTPTSPGRKSHPIPNVLSEDEKEEASTISFPRPSSWFQHMFEQLRDQHNDLRTSSVFKAEEAKLQDVLTRVRNIVGPRIAKWIDEDVAASTEAGKLVCRDLFALDAEFNCSNDDDDSSKSNRGDSEGASHTNSDRKGKGKEKEKDDDNDNDDPFKDSSDKDRASDNTKTSGFQNQRERSVESQSNENAGRQKLGPNLSPAVSRSPVFLPIPEKRNSPLKRTHEAVEDNAEWSEDEVEQSITMYRSSSSILEDSGPVSKKARQGNHVHDTTDTPSGSSGINSRRPNTRFALNSDAGPSTTSSQRATSNLFPPSAFPPVKPSPAPKQPHERTAKPLQRDTMRVRMNPDSGELEVFDYESTPEYRERLQREHYSNYLQPKVCDTKADLQAMTELDGPRFKFNRDAWKDFEDHTLISS